MKQDKGAEIRFFDNLMENNLEYDLIEEGTYKKINSIVNILIKKGEILEAGCGTGAFGNVLAKNNSQFTVIGADISPKMIDTLKKINKEKNYKAKMGDIEEKELFDKESFDLILCPGLLHHFPRLEHTLALSNFHYWLKPEGTLLVWEPNGSNPVDRLSKFIGRLIFFFNKNSRHATINETDHSFNKYRLNLKRNNFRIIYSSTFFDKARDTPKLTVYTLLSKIRWVLFELTACFSFPYNGNFLFLICVRHANSTCIDNEISKIERL